MINDELQIHHSHCDLEEYHTTNNIAACNLVRVQTDLHLWLERGVAQTCDMIIEDEVKIP